MIDSEKRSQPRFPPACEPLALQAIQRVMARHDACPDDVTISSGACGGDILFAEVALARGTRHEIYLPFEPEQFVRNSVDFADRDWHARFEDACKRSRVYVMPRARPELGANGDPYEQVNLWMLEAAWRWGGERVLVVCLWDGQQGDGPGGTADLMEKVERRGGKVEWLDTNTLWNLQ